MRMFGLLFLAVSASAMPQTNFQFGSAPNRKIFIRDEAQETSRGAAAVIPSENELIASEIEGRVPVGEVFENPVAVEVETLPIEETCCCIPESEECQADLAEEELDLVGLGLINPRIVNRPTAAGPTPTSCPAGYNVCCSGGTESEVDMSVFGRSSCLPPTKVVNEPWVQGCEETPVYGEMITGTKACGTQEFSSPFTGLGHGEATPGEFPWSCLILNQDNDFLGSCALIPNDSSNKNENGVRKVITAAHKLNDVKETDILKIRVGEYDASGFKAPEAEVHEEYTVARILKHPAFNPARLSNDIALLFVDRNINLNHPYVNTACLPSCNGQFDFQFSNSTGVRCWVAGWGKNEFDGSFQFLQRKVDVPLVNSPQCNADLKTALNSQSSGVGERFTLDPSELCAGGEVGKDACTGDGGSPLVCQARSGRWTVVGLVTWGVGCAEQLPGVYVRVSQFREWIDNNNADIVNGGVEIEVDADERSVPRTLVDRNTVGSIRFV